MENNKNVVELVGKLTNICKVWSFEDHFTYEATLSVTRDSGIIDQIQILVKDISIEDLISELVEVKGQFRSRDLDINGKLKVELYVYADSIKPINTLFKTSIQMTGYICKKPILRTTPSGKQIADLLVACNYNKDKTAYIPVIAWGKCARNSGKYTVGTQVSIQGRIQSRTYTKELNDSIVEFIVHELSAISVETVNQ